MKTRDYKIIVGLYLRGDDLDPVFVSEKLGVSPSRSQYKGERKVTSTNCEYIAKIGMWALIEESDTSDTSVLSVHIDQLASKVGMGGITFRDIEGVQEAYVDVFIAADADEDGEGTYEFQLNGQNVTVLHQLGLPVRFTVAILTP